VPVSEYRHVLTVKTLYIRLSSIRRRHTPSATTSPRVVPRRERLAGNSMTMARNAISIWGRRVDLMLRILKWTGYLRYRL
jgi:hypothetical protein